MEANLCTAPGKHYFFFVYRSDGRGGCTGDWDRDETVRADGAHTMRAPFWGDGRPRAVDLRRENRARNGTVSVAIRQNGGSVCCV